MLSPSNLSYSSLALLDFDVRYLLPKQATRVSPFFSQVWSKVVLLWLLLLKLCWKEGRNAIRSLVIKSLGYWMCLSFFSHSAGWLQWVIQSACGFRIKREIGRCNLINIGEKVLSYSLQTIVASKTWSMRWWVESSSFLASCQTELACQKLSYVTVLTFPCPADLEEQPSKPSRSFTYPVLAGSPLDEYEEQQVGRKSPPSFSSWKAGIAASPTANEGWP